MDRRQSVAFNAAVLDCLTPGNSAQATALLRDIHPCAPVAHKLDGLISMFVIRAEIVDDILPDTVKRELLWELLPVAFISRIQHLRHEEDFDAFIDGLYEAVEDLEELEVEKKAFEAADISARSRMRLNLRTTKNPTQDHQPAGHMPQANPINQNKPQHQHPDLDRAAIKQYRRDHNLCLYCGGEGHRIADCPNKGPNKIKREAVRALDEDTTPFDPADAVEPLMALDTALTPDSEDSTVHWCDVSRVCLKPYTTRARDLLDTGAANAYVSEEFAKAAVEATGIAASRINRTVDTAASTVAKTSSASELHVPAPPPSVTSSYSDDDWKSVVRSAFRSVFARQSRLVDHLARVQVREVSAAITARPVEPGRHHYPRIAWPPDDHFSKMAGSDVLAVLLWLLVEAAWSDLAALRALSYVINIIHCSCSRRCCISGRFIPGRLCPSGSGRAG
ncbi:hypothetical protein J8273_6695 [Carpediemonas membranifera]|uniref:CCHC-type domain-containing protein n=1 Tax=Carpediemonas membranifera TaxID=201153 RepID=A0A8J6AQW9_9EUKA|nr:hypothetical protein J8273_6695 [Carpediemonas membranifera]|eukprot:KAG9391966.1 hypothetical protein J8273_6695 [Carpediemonas membranifera]